MYVQKRHRVMSINRRSRHRYYASRQKIPSEHIVCVGCNSWKRIIIYTYLTIIGQGQGQLVVSVGSIFSIFEYHIYRQLTDNLIYFYWKKKTYPVIYVYCSLQYNNDNNNMHYYCIYQQLQLSAISVIYYRIIYTFCGFHRIVKCIVISTY